MSRSVLRSGNVRVMEALADGEWLTQAQIRARCGNVDVSGRINALRSQGHRIESREWPSTGWEWRLVEQRGEVIP